jgi:hypothetical protein
MSDFARLENPLVPRSLIIETAMIRLMTLENQTDEKSEQTIELPLRYFQ